MLYAIEVEGFKQSPGPGQPAAGPGGLCPFHEGHADPEGAPHRPLDLPGPQEPPMGAFHGGKTHGVVPDQQGRRCRHFGVGRLQRAAAVCRG